VLPIPANPSSLNVGTCGATGERCGKLRDSMCL
jgi:hypothetical protein